MLKENEESTKKKDTTRAKSTKREEQEDKDIDNQNEVNNDKLTMSTFETLLQYVKLIHQSNVLSFRNQMNTLVKIWAKWEPEYYDENDDDDIVFNEK